MKNLKITHAPPIDPPIKEISLDDDDSPLSHIVISTGHYALGKKIIIEIYDGETESSAAVFSPESAIELGSLLIQLGQQEKSE
jgi:hypothetical protein